MSHFYGVIDNSGRRQSTRCGFRSRGLTTIAATKTGGAIRTDLWYDENSGKDWFRVSIIPWQGRGPQEPFIIMEGPIAPELRALRVAVRVGGSD